MKETVYIKKYDSYDDGLTSVISEMFNEAKVLDLINEDTNVFVKLNLIGPFSPELAITTNPSILDSVLTILETKTKNIIVGDNPAVREEIFVMKKSGLYDVIQKHNVRILDQNNTKKITTTKGKLYNEFIVSSEIVDSDIIINLPKVKTHSLAYITCAEKNFFGLIYGLDKSCWHAKASNPKNFGESLNDLYSALLENRNGKPIFTIADGIEALEGEGPSTGGSKTKGYFLASGFDCVSVDRIVVELMGLNYEKSFINVIANERALGIGDINDIEIVGNQLTDFSNHFKAPKDSLSNVGLRFLQIDFVKSMFFEHPLIDKSKCIKCGECAKICPPKAMIFEKGKNPHAKKQKCIRCWCCAEVCPKDAIYKSHRPLLGKIILK